jgi:hypothetical protein
MEVNHFFDRRRDNDRDRNAACTHFAWIIDASIVDGSHRGAHGAFTSVRMHGR